MKTIKTIVLVYYARQGKLKVEEHQMPQISPRVCFKKFLFL